MDGRIYKQGEKCIPTKFGLFVHFTNKNLIFDLIKFLNIGLIFEQMSIIDKNVAMLHFLPLLK